MADADEKPEGKKLSPCYVPECSQNAQSLRLLYDSNYTSASCTTQFRSPYVAAALKK